MDKILRLILLSFLLTACNLPRTTSDLGAVPPTDTPPIQSCYYNWATQPLPELSAQVQIEMETSGLKDITVRAEAFGENCYDSQTNELISFSAMETDFRIAVRVADLDDKDNLGDLLEKILIALDEFPPEATPGPQPGIVSISFQSGGGDMNLQFSFAEGKSAREGGLQGAALLDELLNK